MDICCYKECLCEKLVIIVYFPRSNPVTWYTETGPVATFDFQAANLPLDSLSHENRGSEHTAASYNNGQLHV